MFNIHCAHRYVITLYPVMFAWYVCGVTQPKSRPHIIPKNELQRQLQQDKRLGQTFDFELLLGYPVPGTRY